MLILGIETSCDETSAAVVKDGREILSIVVASSEELHKKTGGIIPENAAREQIKSILPVIEEALLKASSNFANPPSNLQHLTSNIDAIAVTVGPGLIGSLLVGVETAKTLSYLWKKPIVPVNHLIGHIYANFVREKLKVPQFPAVALVASGGHTDLVLLEKHGELKWLGGTLDDAAGEAFDKTARILGLGFPGGPAIAAAAAKLKIKNDLPAMLRKAMQAGKLKIKLPRPLLDRNNFDFSFSGLKTAVLREVQKNPLIYSPNGLMTCALAHEVQEAITDVLVEKTLFAVKKYKVPTLLICGGVAANFRLREKFQQKIFDLNLDLDFFVPPIHLCTDNAAMIAGAAYFLNEKLPWHKISANPQLHF